MPKKLTIYFSNTEKLPNIIEELARKYRLNKSDLTKFLIVKGLASIQENDKELQLLKLLAELDLAVKEEQQLYKSWKSFLRSYDKAYLLHDQPKEMLRTERIKELIEKYPNLKDPIEVLLNLRRKASQKVEEILKQIKDLIKDNDYKPLEELLNEEYF